MNSRCDICNIISTPLDLSYMFEGIKIGMLGGGQLGSMLLKYAIDFGVHMNVLDNDPEAPCKNFCNSFVVGDPMSYDDVYAFGAELDILTIEKEAVNIQALKALRNKGVKVFPSPESLELIQDKYIQKTHLQQFNIPVVPGILVQNRSEIAQYVQKFPLILKKCTQGYDGYGVMKLTTEQDIQHAFDAPSVLESLIDIDREISVIVVRNECGQADTYEPVHMVFDPKRMLLDYQICPANLPSHVLATVDAMAKKVAEALQITGILAVEMFITRENEVYVNEVAPRPHNSGHHTIESTSTSQYEQLLRVLLGLPIGSTATNLPSVMMNLLEPPNHLKSMQQAALKTILSEDNVHLHWYGKRGGKEGRKMGHITITDPERKNAMKKLERIKNILK